MVTAITKQANCQSSNSTSKKENGTNGLDIGQEGKGLSQHHTEGC